jgi:hypothetical protein
MLPLRNGTKAESQYTQEKGGLESKETNRV